MKIGQFAAQNQTSIDTIRHYMSLGLIIPEKLNKQFEFDEKCVLDFEEITTLKNIGFTLSEIQQLMLYRRIGKLTAYDKRITYTSFFEKKKKQIEVEMNRLSNMNSNLESALLEMKHQIELDNASISEPLGIQLKTLDFLCCPECHQALKIMSGNIQNSQLVNAILECKDHHQVHIVDGIVIINGPHLSESLNEGSSDIDIYSENYIDNYINTTHMDYLQKLHEGLQWSSRHMDFERLSDKIALELGSGHGFFMRHMIDLFPETLTYIAVDHDIIKLKWLKRIIERSHHKCEIVFICSDFTQMPLKPKSVDLVLDISGSSNYAFDHTDFLLHSVDDLVKEDAALHGYYILFNNFMPKSEVALAFRDGFSLKSIQSNIKKLNYKCIADHETDAVENGGPFEDYFIEGERVSTYLYIGRKEIKPLG